MLIYLMDGPKGPAKPAILRFSSFLFFPNFGPGADFPNPSVVCTAYSCILTRSCPIKTCVVFQIPAVWTSLNNTDIPAITKVR